MRRIDVTNVGRQHDLTELLRPAEELAMEEALLLPQETPEDGVG